jgi:hypothetical protein
MQGVEVFEVQESVGRVKWETAQIQVTVNEVA